MTDKFTVERGIAQGAHQTSAMTDLARRGMIEFFKEQIVDAEWQIARHRARITAYETAVAAIESRTTGPVVSGED